MCSLVLIYYTFVRVLALVAFSSAMASVLNMFRYVMTVVVKR